MAFLIIGLAIGVATIVGLYSITMAMEREVADRFDEIGANITVVPQADDLALSYGGISVSDLSFDVKDLDMSAIDRIWSIHNKENIAIVAPKLMGTTIADNKEILLIGVDFKSELRMKKWWEINGTKPEAPEEILLGYELARELAKEPGDGIEIQGQTFQVAAVLNPVGGQEDYVAFMDLAETQDLLGKPESLSFVEVAALCSTCPIEEIVEQISEKLPEAKVTAVKEVVQARQEIVERFSSLALAVSGIVLVVGALVVLVTMMSSVNERTREIGIFRAIGFRESHVIRIILMEAFFVSVIGGIIGYLMGMLGAMAVGPVIAEMDVLITWHPEVALAAVGIAVVIGLMASSIPAIKAAAKDPVEALRFI